MKKKGGLLRGTVISLGLRAAGTAAGFGFNLLIARTLGIAEAGVFFLVLSLINILAMFGRFGVDVVVARYLAVAYANKNYPLLRGSAALGLGVSFAGAFIWSLMTWISAPYAGEVIFGDEHLVSLIRIAAFAIVPLALQKVFSDMLLVTGNIWASQLIQNFMPSAANCLLFWIAILLFHSPGSMVAIDIAVTVVALLAAAIWWSDLIRRQGTVEFPDIRKFLKACAGAFGVTVAGLGITAVSPLILGLYSDKDQIALFTAASRISMIAALISLSVQNISMGNFAVAFAANDIGDLKRHARHSAMLSAALSVMFLIPFILFSEVFMRLFGQNYVAGAPVLVVLCVGQLIASLFGPVNSVLLMTGHEIQVRNYAGLMMIAGIVLHVLLVPSFGALGAAFASSTAFVGAILILAWVVRRRLGFWPIIGLIR